MGACVFLDKNNFIPDEVSADERGGKINSHMFLNIQNFRVFFLSGQFQLWLNLTRISGFGDSVTASFGVTASRELSRTGFAG